MSDDERSGAPEDPEDILRALARDVRNTAALQALVPLTPALREQLADRAIEYANESANNHMLGGDEPRPGAPSEPRVRPERRRAMIAAVALAGGLAAAITVYVARVGPPAPRLAEYTMLVEGEQRTRGSAAPVSAEPIAVRPETRLVIRLAPAQPERDALLRVLLVRDGRAVLLDPVIARSRSGGFEITEPAAELFGDQRDGPGELVVVLGRSLPDDDEVRAVARTSAARTELQVRRRAIAFTGFSHTAAGALLGGCHAVFAGPGPPRCETAPGAALALWIDAPVTAAVEIDLDGARLALAPEARGGGSRFAIDARAGSLSVALDDRAIAAWELVPAAHFAAIEASDRARAAGQLDDALAALETAAPSTEPARLELEIEIIRRRAKLARLRGDAVAERSLRDRAVALSRTLGLVSVESDETVAILYGLREQHALGEAARLLPALDAHGTLYAEGAVRRDLIDGLIASELGDLGAALGAFRRALATADRIGDTADRAALLAPMADVLQLLGRERDARGLIDAEIERAGREAEPCARADALTNAGWLLRDSAPSAAQHLVDQAVDLARERCTHRLAIAMVNQGWLLAAAHRLVESRHVLQALESIAGLERDGLVETWARRLEAEILLGEDPSRAERHAHQLAVHAAALCSPELAYEAHLLLARAQVALARPAEAAEALRAAARALTRWSRLVPLGEGRDTFFARHDQLALAAIPFFVAELRRGTAGADLALSATVRASIARFVDSLAAGGRARARAERGERTPQPFSRRPGHASDGSSGEPVAGACAVLDAEARASDPPLGPLHGDALLVHPTQHGWIVIAWRRGALAFRELPASSTDGDPAALSARFADAAAPLLRGAQRVHLHVHRSIAALPLDRRLAARLAVPVAFAVEAPPRRAEAQCHGARRALLVSNPQRNLWEASQSAPQIRGALARIGLAVDALDGPAATRAAIVQRLADPCTVLFEYDGHAGAPHRSVSAPGDRIDDALLLAGGEVLTAAEVLELDRVPPAIVLDGCTTAAPEGLGLAHAFVLAGASQVIASLDDLSADAAARFTRDLFDDAPPEAELDLVSLFGRAIGRADLAAMRVYER